MRLYASLYGGLREKKLNFSSVIFIIFVSGYGLVSGFTKGSGSGSGPAFKEIVSDALTEGKCGYLYIIIHTENSYMYLS